MIGLDRACLATATTAVLISVSNAQSPPCLLNDASCLQREMRGVCWEQQQSLEPCLAWLEMMANIGGSMDSGVRMLVAQGYVGLSNLYMLVEGEHLTAERSGMSASRARARDLYREILSEDPTNAGALTGLAGLIDNLDETIELLRQRVAIDAADTNGLLLLAEFLDRSGELLEAAELRERIYMMQSDGGRDQRLASEAVSSYEAAGATDRAAELRARVRADYRLDDKLQDLERIDAESPARSRAILTELCTNELAVLFGPDPCLDGIDRVAAIAETAGTIGEELAEAAVDGIQIAVRAWRLHASSPDLRRRLLSTMDRMFMWMNESAHRYAVYAQVTDDPAQRLRSMESAVALAPDDGAIVFGLGLAYLEERRIDDGVDLLERSRDLLPPEAQSTVDLLLQQAQTAQR